MVYEAGPPAVLDQLIAQPLRIISVFLDIPCFGFHLCLLVEAVVGEAAVSGGSFLLYDTALTVVCKTAYAVCILFLEKLVLLVIAVSGFFFVFCFLDLVSVSVILIIKGQQDGTFRSGFQMADVTVTVIGVIRLYTVFITDPLNAVKTAITVLHIHVPCPM
mgnify:CR=1 FL=1